MKPQNRRLKVLALMISGMIKCEVLNRIMNKRTQGKTLTKEIYVNMSDFECVNLRGGWPN
jgi:hypothetical protein